MTEIRDQILYCLRELKAPSHTKYESAIDEILALISEARRSQIEADVATIDGVKATYADAIARMALARAQDALLAKEQK